MKEFFISYTSADLHIASWIAWVLEEEGYSVVFQQWDFREAGKDVIDNIDNALKECERTIALLSPDYFNSAFTSLEWKTALHKDPEGRLGLLVPVIVRECAIEGVLRRLASVSLLGLEEEEAKTVLLEALRRDRAKPAAKPLFKKANPQHSDHKPRYPGSLPAVCNLSRRNPNFTGRENILETLRTSLQSGKNTAITQQAIYGLGGIGKTQLAIEYAWRNIAAYDIIWWIRSEDSSTLASDYAALADELDLPEKDAQEQAVTIRAVKKYLDHNQNWLLIFDNARDSDSIRNYLPTSTGGHALITSRNQNWNNTLCRSNEIEVWNREESVAFLHKRITGSDDTAAATLAETLGGLPLALEQAAAYCNARHKSCAEYLDLFTTCRQDLWNREKQPDNYPDTVATTWTLAFQETERVPCATDILNLCSLVAPDTIPQTLILQALNFYAAKEGKPPAGVLQIDDAIEALVTYSLITLEQKFFSIHRLVQTVAQDRMQPEARERYRASAIKALSEQFPEEGYNNPACWQECAVLTPHAETLIEPLADYTALWNEFSRLLDSMASYFYAHAHFGKVEPLLRRLLAMKQKALGPDHPDVALIMNNLGHLLYSRGNYSESETLYRHSLAIWEKALGPLHPDVAWSLNNLAELLRAQGRYAEAEPLNRRSLAIVEKALAPDHLDVAQSMNNFAILLFVQGNHAEAEPLYRRSLAIREKALGPHHPYVAGSLNNLALLLEAQGNYAEAEPLYRRSLAIEEQAYGNAHPDVATTLNNLAALLKAQGNFQEAEPLCRRALANLEKTLGPDHPNTIKVRNNLNELLDRMKKL